MSYFDDASLVMIPSGYKTSKVYSVKPTDGAGDLTFTRSNDTATRVGPDGLIEKVRTNLLTYSEDWTNAAWTKTNATVTGNATTNPIDGAATADAIFETTTNGQHNFFQSFSVTVGTEVTISFYAKANGRTKLRMNNGSSSLTAAFDLTAVTASMLTGTGTPTITSVGSGWFRCSLTHNAAISQLIAMNFRDDADQDTYAGDITKGMYFFGGQAETGVLTDYIATTTAAVSVGPVANVPRLDYLNSSCPRLLLEPQRTNFVTYSEQFNNAAWTSASFTVGANTTISPDGYQNADTLPFTASASSNIFTFPTTAVTGAHVFTIYAKVASGTKTFRLRIDTGSGPEVSGDLTATTTWQRFTLPFTSTNVNLVAYVFNDTAGTAGNLIVWGAQLEVGAYATSYIPTLGAAVTRGADAASKTGISSLIGQTEGTLFIDMEFEGYDNLAKWIAFLGTGNSYIGFYTDNVSRFFAEVANAGVGQFNSVTFVFAVGQRYKLALAYKENDFAFYVNGTQVATDNSGTVPATSQFDFQYNTTANNLTARTYNQALLFKTRLTNAQLAELTTI